MGKGSKPKKNFRKVPISEVFSTTSVPDNNRIARSHGLNRGNNWERSPTFKTTTVAPSTSIASSCEMDRNIHKSLLNDNGIDNSHVSYIPRQSTVEPINVCNSYNTTKDSSLITEQVMKLDVGYTEDQILGIDLNADAAEFIPTAKEKTTDFKSSLSNHPESLSHQTGNFRHSDMRPNRYNFPNNYEPISIDTVGNFTHNINRQYTRESYTPPLDELHQKQQSTRKNRSTNKTQRNTDYLNSQDHMDHSVINATQDMFQEDSKDDNEIIEISDSGSESTEKRSLTKGSNNFKNQTKRKTTKGSKVKHRSKSRGSAGSHREEHSHRSESLDKTMTEKKYKNKYTSRNKIEPSHIEDSCSIGVDRTHEAQRRDKQDLSDNATLESKRMGDDLQYSRQRNPTFKSDNRGKNKYFQSTEYRKRDKKNIDTFAGSSEENLDNDLNVKLTNDEPTESDSQPWEQVKGNKNRGTQYQRKYETSRYNEYDQKTSYQNRRQINRKDTYTNDHNEQKPFNRQAESRYDDTKSHNQSSVNIPDENGDSELVPDCNRQSNKNIQFAWKNRDRDVNNKSDYTGKNHNQTSFSKRVASVPNDNEREYAGRSRDTPAKRDMYFDTDKATRSYSNFANNSCGMNSRQSLPKCSRDAEDRVELPQRRSLGQERHQRKFRDPRMERSTSGNWRENSQPDDPEYKAFLAFERSGEEMKYVRVKEIFSDLFEMPKEYSLAHCVAEDLSMGSGIAVQFKRDFKGLSELYDQRQKQGGLAILEQQQGDLKRYIYYLVTKRTSSGKPTYWTFWSSVKKMRDHIRDNGVEKLAIPRIGCGLDRLDWSRVKPMVEFLFHHVDIEIVVCNFQQDGDTPTKENRGLYCKVIREKYNITQLENGSIIIYFSTEDGFISEEMQALEEKFNFIPQFYQARKTSGETIRFEDRKSNNVLYGCIVRKNMNEPFKFTSFQKCLAQINKQNKTDLFNYVGIPAVRDESDVLLNFKIVHAAKTYLKYVTIYQCLGQEEGDMSSVDIENEDITVSSIDFNDDTKVE